MLPLVLIALVILWIAAAILAVSLCVVAGRAERRTPLFLVGSR